MRDELMKSDGFVSIERFESLYEEGKLLSLQFWRDEESVRKCANASIIGACRPWAAITCSRTIGLRVASVLRDYSLQDRHEAPADSREAHG